MNRINALIVAVLLSCVACAGVVTQVEASATAPTTVEAYSLPAPTATTALVLIATKTPTQTMTATPTAMKTATPSIIEVTPAGPEPLTGIYTPNGRQNVRACAGRNCPIVRQISRGKPVQVFGWYSYLPQEAWLCVNRACTELVALVLDYEEYGKLEITQ